MLSMSSISETAHCVKRGARERVNKTGNGIAWASIPIYRAATGAMRPSLGLGEQPPAHPFGVRPCLLPGHIDDGIAIELGIVIVPIATG